MHVPTEEELAAIAVAYLSLKRSETPPAPPVSRWRLAARALAPDARRSRWNKR
jgi:hypothetical protein